MTRILVVGIPRSGTTWVANVIAAAPGVQYVLEPDNEQFDPFAAVGTREMGLLPALRPGDDAPAYRLLWDMAFAGGWPRGRLGGVARVVTATRGARLIPSSAKIHLHEAVARVARRRPPTGEHQLVKSVRALLAVEWIVETYRPIVIVVWRHPLNVLGSWLERGWWGAWVVAGVPAVRDRFALSAVWPQPPRADRVASAAWAVCAQAVLLLETAARHPRWTVVAHEELSSDPVVGFRRLLAAIGLDWDPGIERRIAESDRSGSGYETSRVAFDEAKRWRSRLNADEIAAANRVIAGFEEVSRVAMTMWRASWAVRGEAGLGGA